MDISKRCRSLAFTAAVFFLAGHVHAEEAQSAQMIAEASSNACDPCSVTCPTPSVQAVGKKSGDRVKAISFTDVHGTVGGKNPAYLKKGGFYLSADFLYWKAQEDGLEYAATFTPTDDTGLSFSEKLKGVNFRWKPGFRIDAGYVFGMHDSWDLGLEWTWFYGKARSSVSIPASSSSLINPAVSPSSFIFPTWGSESFAAISEVPLQLQPLISPCLNASATWSLHYNMLDFDLGRHYFVTKAFSLKPYIGVRGGWINQDYIAEYAEVLNRTLFPAQMRADFDFKGVGPRLGLDLHWHFNCQWSLVGEVSGAVLYGPYKSRQTYTSFVAILDAGDFDLAAPLVYTNVRNQHPFQANFETALGLQWEEEFISVHMHRRHRLSLGAYYEFSQWFRQNRLIRSLPQIETDILLQNNVDNDFFIKEHGDLGLQGFSIKARLDF